VTLPTSVRRFLWVVAVFVVAGVAACMLTRRPESSADAEDDLLGPSSRSAVRGPASVEGG
jgi:hypothetical protein